MLFLDIQCFTIGWHIDIRKEIFILHFMFLFFIIDLQDQISDMFKQEGNSLVDIGLFFLFILPEKIPLVVPMSLLLGTMYCFSNLNRHNEINAIRSSGISIFKMSIPVFIFPYWSQLLFSSQMNIFSITFLKNPHLFIRLLPIRKRR